MRKGIPNGTRRNTVAVKRREAVAELYLLGKTQYEIAAQFGVSQQRISQDLQVIHEWWRSSAVEKIDRAKARELARIDLVEREAWQRHYAGVGPHSVNRKESGGRDGTKAVTTTEELNGNPQWLNTILDCVKKRCAILGIDAPTKLSNPDGSSLLEGLKVVYVQPTPVS